MPLKRRVGKARDPLSDPATLAEAAELFRRGLELQRRGADQIDYEAEEKTAEQLEYRAIEYRLHWQLLKIPCDLGPLDVGPGQPITGGEGFTRTAPHAREIRKILLAEIRRRRG